MLEGWSKHFFILKKEWIQKISKKTKISGLHVLFLIAILVGVTAGYLAVLFRLLIQFIHHFFFEILYPFLSQYSEYTLPLIPMIGALLLIPFSKLYPGEVNGYGMPQFLILVHLKGGLIKARVIFLKMITAAITIGTGGSAGVEGPIAQIGGAVGSTIGRFFEMSTMRIQVLIACGSAAGIAAQFNAPLAGVLFAQEIIMAGKIKLETFGVIVISSGMATAISRAYFSSEPILGKLSYHLDSLYELPFYILLGVFIGFFGFLFIQLFHYTEGFFQKLSISNVIKPIIGAFLVGVFGLFQFEILGEGYEAIHKALTFDPSLTFTTVLSLILFKMLATSITIGSGNAGGVFGPSLFIGAVLGLLWGLILQFCFPQISINPGSYALVGMGAFLAAITHAPMTCIFLLFELTNDYHVIVPIMFASVIGVIVARKLCKDSLDSLELSRRGIKLNSGKETNIMKSLQVREVMRSDFEWVFEKMKFSEFLKYLHESKVQYYPVLNQEKELVGIISFQDIRQVFTEEGLQDFLIMQDIMATQLITLFPSDSLATAIEKFSIKDIELLPVVDPEKNQKIVGVLTRKDVMTAYNRAVLLKQIQENKEL